MIRMDRIAAAGIASALSLGLITGCGDAEAKHKKMLEETKPAVQTYLKDFFSAIAEEDALFAEAAGADNAKVGKGAVAAHASYCDVAKGKLAALKPPAISDTSIANALKRGTATYIEILDLRTKAASAYLDGLMTPSPEALEAFTSSSDMANVKLDKWNVDFNTVMEAYELGPGDVMPQ